MPLRIRNHIAYPPVAPKAPAKKVRDRSGRNRGVEWSNDDRKYLRDNWLWQTSHNIAAKLNRTNNSVCHMAAVLKLPPKT